MAATHSLRQERKLAKRLNGRVTPGSGNQFTKGDVQLKKVMRIECKATEKKSFRVTKEMIDKIEEAAMSSGELPAIEINLVNERGRVTHSVCVVPTWALDEMKEARCRS